MQIFVLSAASRGVLGVGEHRQSESVVDHIAHNISRGFALIGGHEEGGLLAFVALSFAFLFKLLEMRKYGAYDSGLACAGRSLDDGEIRGVERHFYRRALFIVCAVFTEYRTHDLPVESPRHTLFLCQRPPAVQKRDYIRISRIPFEDGVCRRFPALIHAAVAFVVGNYPHPTVACAQIALDIRGEKISFVFHASEFAGGDRRLPSFALYKNLDLPVKMLVDDTLEIGNVGPVLYLEFVDTFRRDDLKPVDIKFARIRHPILVEISLGVRILFP